MAMTAKVRVAMIAPPWLPIPAKGYGGIENMLGVLVPELIKQGVEVHLFTVQESKVRPTKKHWLYKTGQMEFIHQPWYDTAPIIIGHIQNALSYIRADGKFDIIHDHNNYLGPHALAQANGGLPPAVHTIHNPRFTVLNGNSYGTDMPDNQLMWKQFADSRRLHFIGLSKSLMESAPRELKKLLLPPVHNAVDTRAFPFVKNKSDYFITLARFHPEKGQALAVKICNKLGLRLRMAGNVAGIGSPQKLVFELANPLSVYRSLTDFRYFSDYIFPHMRNRKITYTGEVKGRKKLDFIGRAKALLFPISWDEPFGMAVIEALACGTPVVAMNRGAMPELIEHGVTGFLANSEAEFEEYVQRVDEINPEDCRASVMRKFSGEIMANNYLERYKTVIRLYSKRYKTTG